MNIRICVCIIWHTTRANVTHCSRLSARRSLSSRFRTLSFFLFPAAALFLRTRSCTSYKARYAGGQLLAVSWCCDVALPYLGKLLALDWADWLPACGLGVIVRLRLKRCTSTTRPCRLHDLTDKVGLWTGMAADQRSRAALTLQVN